MPEGDLSAGGPAQGRAGPDGIVWRPSPETARGSRIGRLLAASGLAGLADLQRRSVEDPEWYWDTVCRDVGIRWRHPYRRVLETPRGIAWPRWFEGGLLNLSETCLDRHLDGPGRDRPALIAEADDGQVRTLTFAELAVEVRRLAAALRRLGVGPGDTVGIYLPMSAEAAVAVLAVARIGAIYTPCFSGYGAPAVAARLQDCQARLLITADAFRRRGQTVPMKRTADEAVATCPSVQHVIVHRRTGMSIAWTAGRDVWWHEAVSTASPVCEALPVEADHPALIIEPSRAEKARDVESVGQPIDAHRKIALEFVDKILRQIRVGALVIDVDRDGARLGHGVSS